MIGSAFGRKDDTTLRRLVIIAAAIALLMALLDLIGWWAHVAWLTSVLPGYATMKPNTAACLALVAVAILLTPIAAIGHASRRLANVAAGLAALISGLSLLEYLTHRNFGIDQLLAQVSADRFVDPAGRMSLGTSVALTLTALAVLSRDRFARFSASVDLIALLISVSGIFGFVFDAGPLVGVPWLRSLAVHTAAALTLLQVATLASRPDQEPFFSLAQRGRQEGRRRYLLLAITVIPVLLAFPVLLGLRTGRYDEPFAIAFLLVLLMSFQTYVLWADNRALNVVETKLKRSEEHSSRILESIGDGVVVTDRHGRIQRMNAVAEALTGWTLDEARGLPLTHTFTILNEHTRRTVDNPVEQVMRLGIIVGLANHTILQRRDGTETHIEDSSAPIREDDGTLSGIVLVFRSVDERKAAERLIRMSDERLQLALEAARLGSWELELKHRVLTSSIVCKAAFGRTSDQTFTYADLVEAIHPEDLSSFESDLAQAIEESGLYRSEYRVYWPDGSLHWVVSSGRTLSDEAGEPNRITGVILDVTERHQAAAALIQSEKLAAVGRLASSIAHEINNPLESVTNLLYLARGSNELSEARQYLADAERELQRASAITNQTLRFYKQATKPRLASPQEMIENVLSVFQGKLLNSRVRVEVRSRSRTPILCFDGEIRQVLSNLVGNAIDAMSGASGRLLIRVRETTRRSLREPGIVITVADTGSGMSPATLSKIFEPFYSTKGLSGTGLGLWISEEIVRRHRGFLNVRSAQRPGRSGTVFNMFLPFDAVERSDGGVQQEAELARS